jgi:hypothetical protein
MHDFDAVPGSAGAFRQRVESPSTHCDAEWAFRISKDELELRPVWHQHADRVRGHILVCFISYAMWKTLSGWMKAGGLGEAPRPLVEELAMIKSGDVVLPSRDRDGRQGPTLVVRNVICNDP